MRLTGEDSGYLNSLYTTAVSTVAAAGILLGTAEYSEVDAQENLPQDQGPVVEEEYSLEESKGQKDEKPQDKSEESDKELPEWEVGEGWNPEVKEFLDDYLKRFGLKDYDRPTTYKRMEKKLGDELIYDRDKLFKEIKDKLEGREHTYRQILGGPDTERYSEDFTEEKAEKMDLMALNQINIMSDWIKNNKEDIKEVIFKDLKDEPARVAGIDVNGNYRRFTYPFHRSEAGGHFDVEKTLSENGIEQDIEMMPIHPKPPSQVKKFLASLLNPPEDIKKAQNSSYCDSIHYKENKRILRWHSHATGRKADSLYAGPSINDFSVAYRKESNGLVFTPVERDGRVMTINADFYTDNRRVVDMGDIRIKLSEDEFREISDPKGWWVKKER